MHCDARRLPPSDIQLPPTQAFNAELHTLTAPHSECSKQRKLLANGCNPRLWQRRLMQRVMQ